MRKCVEDKFAMLGDRPVIDLGFQDIYVLHITPSETLFVKAIILFSNFEEVITAEVSDFFFFQSTGFLEN